MKREIHVLKMAENPTKRPGPHEALEGLGKAMRMAGKRKSAAWMKIIVAMLIRVAEEEEVVEIEAVLLAGYET